MSVRGGRFRSAAAGFTLIEMLVVLVVISLALGLIMVRRPMTSPRLEARGAAQLLAQSLRMARARAIASANPVRFVLDAPQRRFAVDGERMQSLPVNLALSVATAAGEAPGSRVGIIAFAPDGSSTGGVIELEGAGDRLQVGADWLTGRVWVHDAR